ncbi:MAG TPA: hypothetical protein PKK31_11680 [Elusimicrobiales bacterium]|nr:hypothetical protein [Elusimicrobiales bacterium]
MPPLLLFILSFYSCCSAQAPLLIDEAWVEDILKINKQELRGVYIIDKTLPVLSDSEIADILSRTEKAFAEQLGQDIAVKITQTLDIETVFSVLNDAKADNYCRDYIINFSSSCDLQAFTEKFETLPGETQGLSERLLPLIRSGRPNMSKRWLEFYGLKNGTQKTEKDRARIAEDLSSLFADSWKRASTITNKGAPVFTSGRIHYYSIPRWRLLFNNESPEFDFILTNAPLLSLAPLPSLHLIQRGSLTGGTLINTLSPFTHSKKETAAAKKLLLISHFIYYFDDPFFAGRDLKTGTDRAEATAYTLLMEYIHARFDMPDSYSRNDIMRPARHFKFKEWIKRARENPFSKDTVPSR